MNSQAELVDLETGERIQFTLVLPSDARTDEGKISVFAPLGTAILGYRVGNEFQWHVPYRIRRVKVTNVYFQPEADLRGFESGTVARKLGSDGEKIASCEEGWSPS
jgi:regulator of nucleoside diphosphate kinase